jgi:hypothetical protein
LQKEKKVFINRIPELYQQLKKQGKEEEGKRRIKDFLTLTFNEDLDEKAKRFLDIPGGLRPAEMEYFRLYWELMQLYINGLFYSAVVLGGVLSERICYDIISQQEIIVSGKEKLSEEQIGCLFKINLFDIIQLLSKWNLIKEDTKKEMIEINNKRNAYVHPSKTASLNAQKDSKEMITRISRILENEFKFNKMA